jgi:hypothetical protein
LTTNKLFPQFGSFGSSDARTVGLGKTYTALANGIFSVGRNPANLMLDSNLNCELSSVLPFPNMNVRFGTDFITIKDYNYFFGGVDDGSGKTIGRYLTASDKAKLNSIFEGGGNVIGNATVNYFSFSIKINDKIGAFAFNMGDVIGSNFNFPEQLVTLGLEGNQIGKVYNFNDAKFVAWWLRNYSLTYSRSIPELEQDIFENISAGLTLKLIHGFAYIASEKVETSLSTGAYNQIAANGNAEFFSAFSEDFNVKYDFDSTKTKKDADVSPFPSPAGTGFGVDFGLSARLDDIWTFGISITDIGSINWTENAARYSSNTAFVLKDITDKDEVDSLKDALTGKGEYVNEISTSLPTALHLGAAFQLDKYLKGNFPGKMLIVLDYNQGFNDQPLNSTKPRFSFGAEWKPMDWIPYLRTGFSFGGADTFGWAFGLGIDASVLELHFATPDFQYLFIPNEAKRISLAIGSKWKL